MNWKKANKCHNVNDQDVLHMTCVQGFAIGGGWTSQTLVTSSPPVRTTRGTILEAEPSNKFPLLKYQYKTNTNSHVCLCEVGLFTICNNQLKRWMMTYGGWCWWLIKDDAYASVDLALLQFELALMWSLCAPQWHWRWSMWWQWGTAVVLCCLPQPHTLLLLGALT